MEDSAAFEEALNSMFVEENRVATFDGVNWPFPKRRKCRPANLAKAGFIYKGTSDSLDNVQCFLCEKELDGWEPGDDPMKEHERHSPRCPFVTLSLVESRLATFKLWPKHLYKASPKEFAAAGFVYLPCKESPDQLRCFKCKKSLDGWEEDDDPYEEHFNHNKRCTYIKTAKKRRDEAAKRQQQEKEEEEEERAGLEAATQQQEQSEDNAQQETEQSEVEENDENAERPKKQAGGKTRKKKKAGKRKGKATQKKQTANAAMNKSETETENTATEQDTSIDETADTEEPATVKASKSTSKRIAAKATSPNKKKKAAPLQDSTNNCESPQQIKKQQRQQQEEPKSAVDVDLEDPEMQNKTVKEFLDEVKDTMIHSIVAEAEEKIQQFRSKAAETRAQIEALLQ